MRFLFFILGMLFLAQANTDTKIKTTTNAIETLSKSQKDLNFKMSQNADAILKQKNEIAAQEKELQELNFELEERESHYESSKVQLSELQDTEQNLQLKIDKIEAELKTAMAQAVSLSIILDQKYSATESSLMENEVLAIMLKQIKDSVKDLRFSHKESSSTIANLKTEIDLLQKKIKSIEAKRGELTTLKEKNKKMLNSLESAKSSYKKELQTMLNKEDELKNTLSKLNIIKIDEQKKAQEKMEREAALKKKDIAIPSSENLPDVKQRGSSYQEVKTIFYSGKKSIPPFKPYIITKKYGNYVDPLYGIKVFNESINLKSNSKDQKIQVVFDGKVVYADKSPVLNNTVIVEHSDGLHTIYANLSQIAPNIKKGAKVKQGAILGRIDDELIFEATQKSFHINPANLFE